MNGNGKKSHRKRWIFGGLGLVVVLLIALGLIAATRSSTKLDPSKLAPVTRGDLAKSVVATGKVEPITKVEVKSKASGIVTKLYVDAGSRVKKGQLLAQLDKEEIESQVAQSKAALQAAEANLESSRQIGSAPRWMPRAPMFLCSNAPMIELSTWRKMASFPNPHWTTPTRTTNWL